MAPEANTKEPWDGVDRRVAQAPVGVTALNIAKRTVDDGETAISPGAVRIEDLGNKDLRSRVGDILDAVNRDKTKPKEPIAVTEQYLSLQRFESDYKKLPKALKAKCPWKTAKARLSANDGEKLRLAQAMEQGGILFGVDNDGKLLFADKGDEPIMKGMNYPDTRARVLFKHDRLDKSGKMELGEDEKPISTGYEMFPSAGNFDKSDEILQYESSTGKPFVTSPNGYEQRSSWLESGEDPSLPRAVIFRPNVGSARVRNAFLQSENHNCGVRRLLRV